MERNKPKVGEMWLTEDGGYNNGKCLIVVTSHMYNGLIVGYVVDFEIESSYNMITFSIEHGFSSFTLQELIRRVE